MKKIILTAVLLTTVFPAWAVAPGGPGCGWGNMLFRGQGGFPSHFVASTTNGTTGNKTFGMTTGTNGCSTRGRLAYHGSSMINLGAILDEFSEDVAMGDGEAITAVAVSMGIAYNDRPLFKQILHQHFDVLFPHADVTAEQVMQSIIELLQADPTLNRYIS